MTKKIMKVPRSGGITAKEEIVNMKKKIKERS
jgi:hypothetical protein